MNDLLTVPEVSEMTRIPQGTIRYWRHQSTGPKSFKLGRRVMYKREDVEAWMQAQYDAEPIGSHA